MSSQTFLILFLFPITILSVFVSVRGSPVNSTSYVSKTFLNLTWKSCITRCVIVADCILVHSNSLNRCYLYAVGDIIQVRNDRDGYSIMNETVAFRMRNSPYKCSNRSSDMLFGVINLYNKDNITSYEITMSPTNEYYEIKYGRSKLLEISNV
ncbi:PAN-3 domain-containing protein [Caenorhabditis elegans]|uniref:PAN-3 domain-containing protein n=1 Tax=Caenorhabditis elegans TaxID=6239 RepID=Q4W500_CAEEL|nr:PAN-3 domain-containing protein [Caenorhabditis elegans]CCD71784.1 PAN-3 domain-containing protein [Caenorhabditis elegans]|eukprot:NP_001022194.1 Uncharacterized protein CELE_F54D12.10 [Caenorhabditis elegans]